MSRGLYTIAMVKETMRKKRERCRDTFQIVLSDSSTTPKSPIETTIRTTMPGPRSWRAFS
jgi:hypothetical protein